MSETEMKDMMVEWQNLIMQRVKQETNALYDRVTDAIVKNNNSTIRDYFAAKAMQALLHNWKEEVIPQMAYKIADEMLAEREK
jgi:predicted nucleic acid-binding OB-fold protein